MILQSPRAIKLSKKEQSRKKFSDCISFWISYESKREFKILIITIIVYITVHAGNGAFIYFGALVT